jgi:hypothetical protein
MTDELFSRAVPGGQVVIEMTGWDGRSSVPKFLHDWPAAIEFIASPGFRPMGGIRRLTVRDVGRASPSPRQAEVIAARAQRDIRCGACGADPGRPCTDVPPGRAVHGGRWAAAARRARSEARAGNLTGAQRAALARLPRIPAEEIEACRLPGGGHNFTREWFLAHDLPYPPVAGWRKAVERAEDTGPDEDTSP